MPGSREQEGQSSRWCWWQCESAGVALNGRCPCECVSVMWAPGMCVCVWCCIFLCIYVCLCIGIVCLIWGCLCFCIHRCLWVCAVCMCVVCLGFCVIGCGCHMSVFLIRCQVCVECCVSAVYLGVCVCMSV